VARICEAGGDPLGLRVRLIEALRAGVGFDAYAFVLTDPETSVGVAPLADVPCLPELPRLIRLKYLTTVNRWTQLAGVATLRQATGDEPGRSLLWRELLGRYDVGDVASLALRDRYGCWGFLDLWRTGTAALFDRAEVHLLDSLTAPMTAALRVSQAGTFAVPAPRPARLGPVVLIHSADLEVLGKTLPTQAYLRTLIPSPDDRSPIPASAYNVAAQLLALRSQVDTNPAMARVHLTGGRWLTLRAAPLDDPAEQRIAVSIEDSSPAERLAVFARAHALSARETDLLRHLVAGLDTRDTAREMVVSEHTVQDHVKSIFAKTATRNRRALVSRATG
jgi:DNA-binding CsgD family transcriptional regulator